ncbi:MAG: class I SAM-dependent methyltransferase [Magnetococcales bacterium]|nr:class I SAM-dependent methyltransferase [Magnetococcales bacterium]
MENLSENIYNADYYRSMRGDGKSGKLLYDIFFKQVSDLPLNQLTCLDVGCGRGEFLAYLIRAGAKDIYGFDFSQTAIKESHDCLRELVPPDKINNIKCGSIEQPDLYPDNFFDLITMMDVVEHLNPHLLASGLKNIQRWLKPGGRLVIHTFPTLGPHRLYQTYLRLTGKKELLSQIDAIHCNPQTQSSMLQYLKDAKLICEKIWLQNDLIYTSTAYNQMADGALKSCTKFFIHDLLQINLLQSILSKIGMAEYANLSIYSLCTKKNAVS